MKSPWVVGVVLALSACSSPLVPDTEPGLVGEIVQVETGFSNIFQSEEFQIHVKSDPDEECGIVFDVPAGTLIADSGGGSMRAASNDVLIKGATVAVWFGMVLESCPGQSVAEAVERRN